VIAPRLSSRVGFPPVGERWQDTIIELPESLALNNTHEIFANCEIQMRDRQLKIADALTTLPFAVITNADR
jgi:hypothetical protein